MGLRGITAAPGAISRGYEPTSSRSLGRASPRAHDDRRAVLLDERLQESFPARFRQALASAESTFRSGDPAKGCAIVYDEIEALSRRIAEKSYDQGLWTKNKPTTNPTDLDFKKDSWATVARTLHRQLDRKQVPDLTEALLDRLVGITPYRNAVGHKVTDRKSLMKRDRTLRTRFEEAVDLLGELITASKSLRP